MMIARTTRSACGWVLCTRGACNHTLPCWLLLSVGRSQAWDTHLIHSLRAYTCMLHVLGITLSR